MEVETTKKNGPTSGYYSDARGGARPRSIANRKAVTMVPVWRPEVDRRLMVAAQSGGGVSNDNPLKIRENYFKITCKS